MPPSAEDLWYHVTPLFLLPSILQSGGLKCGADVRQAGLPRRRSSHTFDDQMIQGLGGRPSDCVLLFTARNPPLLTDKVQHRGRWKAYPHVVLQFSSAMCRMAAGGVVF